MWAVDKVSEESGAEVAAGMEPSQDKVWIFPQGVFLWVYNLPIDSPDAPATVLSR